MSQESPAPDGMTVRWWGHATATIDLGGTRVLTDPIFAQRLAHLRRLGGAAPAPESLRADVVLVSHLHRDHLHVPSLAALPASTRIVLPRGGAAVVTNSAPELRGRLEEIQEGEHVQAGGVMVEAVPAEHDGRRAPGSRFRCNSLGFRLHGAGQTAWFAGDTGLFDAMTAVGPVDVALVPVGGWGPTLGPEHLDPAQAVEAVARVHARHAIPLHFGTYWPAGLRWAHPMSYRRLFREPGARFVDEAGAVLGDGVTTHLLGIGEAVTIARTPEADSAAPPRTKGPQ